MEDQNVFKIGVRLILLWWRVGLQSRTLHRISREAAALYVYGTRPPAFMNLAAGYP